MIVENLKLYNWHKEVVSYYYPTLNTVLTMGVSKLINKTDTNLVGIWKIKKLK